MPRFKTPDCGLKMIPVDFARQFLPGTFQFALSHLVNQEVDLSGLRARFRNDASGAPAFDPAVLIKIVLLGCSRRLTSSRTIAAACAHNALFMAVSGDSCPHFTTIAATVPQKPRHHQDATGRFLHGKARQVPKPYRPDEGEDRFGRRQAQDQCAFR